MIFQRSLVGWSIVLSLFLSKVKTTTSKRQLPSSLAHQIPLHEILQTEEHHLKVGFTGKNPKLSMAPCYHVKMTHFPTTVFNWKIVGFPITGSACTFQKEENKSDTRHLSWSGCLIPALTIATAALKIAVDLNKKMFREGNCQELNSTIILCKSI